MFQFVFCFSYVPCVLLVVCVVICLVKFFVIIVPAFGPEIVDTIKRLNWIELNLKNETILGRYFFYVMHATWFATFSHILVWQSQSQSWHTKFGKEHFPETPYIRLPVPEECELSTHRRWIKSIGLLFLLHNAGSVSVLADPQLINGQDRLLWSW